MEFPHISTYLGPFLGCLMTGLEAQFGFDQPFSVADAPGMVRLGGLQVGGDGSITITINYYKL